MMSKESHPASITETAFECPHCDVYTTQYWFTLYADRIKDDQRIPSFADEDSRESIEQDKNIPAEAKERLLKYCDQIIAGLIVTERHDHNADYSISNLHLSKCYNCDKIAAWIHGNLVFPYKRSGAVPNQDLPEDIVRDFEEARSVVDISPRGAAALMRLVIQKLCGHLGESGKDLDADIASLVAKGLNPLVQQSLDFVRVIGNESVHPGVLDMKDDRETATKLFDLVNAIADQMITHPKHVRGLYEKIPPGKREAIETRNAKATGKGS
jgi:hypothetical protein